MPNISFLDKLNAIVWRTPANHSFRWTSSYNTRPKTTRKSSTQEDCLLLPPEAPGNVCAKGSIPSVYVRWNPVRSLLVILFARVAAREKLPVEVRLCRVGAILFTTVVAGAAAANDQRRPNVFYQRTKFLGKLKKFLLSARWIIFQTPSQNFRPKNMSRLIYFPEKQELKTV